MSAFVWLDYSERERRKMLDVVDLFRAPTELSHPLRASAQCRAPNVFLLKSRSDDPL